MNKINKLMLVVAVSGALVGNCIADQRFDQRRKEDFSTGCKEAVVGVEERVAAVVARNNYLEALVAGAGDVLREAIQRLNPEKERDFNDVSAEAVLKKEVLEKYIAQQIKVVFRTITKLKRLVDNAAVLRDTIAALNPKVDADSLDGESVLSNKNRLNGLVNRRTKQVLKELDAAKVELEATNQKLEDTAEQLAYALQAITFVETDVVPQMNTIPQEK